MKVKRTNDMGRLVLVIVVIAGIFGISQVAKIQHELTPDKLAAKLRSPSNLRWTWADQQLFMNTVHQRAPTAKYCIDVDMAYIEQFYTGENFKTPFYQFIKDGKLPKCE